MLRRWRWCASSSLSRLFFLAHTHTQTQTRQRNELRTCVSVLLVGVRCSLLVPPSPLLLLLLAIHRMPRHSAFSSAVPSTHIRIFERNETKCACYQQFQNGCIYTPIKQSNSNNTQNAHRVRLASHTATRHHTQREKEENILPSFTSTIWVFTLLQHNYVYGIHSLGLYRKRNCIFVNRSFFSLFS